MPLLNPFLYGRPVPPERHIGRQAALYTLFSRLSNGESTAVAGGPHIGKSSLLRYVQDMEVRAQRLGQDAPKYAFTEIDCHLIPGNFTPADFWRQALAQLPQANANAMVASQWPQVVNSEFSSFALENFFRLVARSGQRIVLVIDEFDVLLHHASFNAEFFGTLRSVATRTDGLAVIIASRLPVTAMNHLKTTPSGSPLFNYMTEVSLPPFSANESHDLIQKTLARTGVDFTQDDHTCIHKLAGYYPFPVQVAAAGMFDAVLDGKTGEARHEAVRQFFHHTATAYFDNLWQHLTPLEKMAMLLLTLEELKGCVDGRTFHTKDLEQVKWYGPELERLQTLGMIEQVKQPSSFHWRIVSHGFVWWVTRYVIAESRASVDFAQWLHNQEYGRLLTQGQVERVSGWVKSLPTAEKIIELISKLPLSDIFQPPLSVITDAQEVYPWQNEDGVDYFKDCYPELTMSDLQKPLHVLRRLAFDSPVSTAAIIFTSTPMS